MSPYPRFIWEFTVPTGGWDFDTSLTAVVTIPAGTYDIFELCDELKTQLDADPSAHTWTVEVSSIGTVSITSDAGVAWTITWATTDDDLEDALGLDGTEVEDASHVIYGNLQHQYGYYPGTISYGRNVHEGCHTTNTRHWNPESTQVRTKAGNHSVRSVGPATEAETMEMMFGVIRLDERIDEDIGLRAFQNFCRTAQFKYYEDRSVGTVAGLPHAQDTDYWLCTIDLGGDVRVREQGKGLFSWSCRINKEP